MTDCKFKVGETYKDREGCEWVLVGRTDEFSTPLVFRMRGSVHNGRIEARKLDGTLGVFDGAQSTDILPNKRKEWVIIYAEEGELYAEAWESKEVAKKRLQGLVDHNLYIKSDHYTEMRGPMFWESED